MRVFERVVPVRSTSAHTSLLLYRACGVIIREFRYNIDWSQV